MLDEYLACIPLDFSIHSRLHEGFYVHLVDSAMDEFRIDGRAPLYRSYYQSISFILW